MLLNTIVRWAMVAWLLAIVTGCATVNQGIPEKLEPSSGVVVSKIVSVQRLGFTNGKWTRLTVVEQKSGLATELVDTTTSDPQQAVFAQPLPAGTYTIKSLDAPGVAPGTFGILGAAVIQAMTSDSHGHQGFGSFTVEPGVVTNLGMVVAAPPREGEKQMAMAVIADERGQAAAISDLDAASRRHAQGLRTRGWDHAADPTQAERAQEIVRSRATYVSQLDVTRDGSLLMGTAMGLVHVRNAAGQWSTLPTGTLDVISYVRELADGRIFAGANNGRYHLWDPGTRTWTSRRVAEDGRVMHLEPLGPAGFALLVTNGMQMNVPSRAKVLIVKDLVADAPARDALTLEGFPAMGALPIVFDGRELLVVFNHVGFSRSADLYRIDPATAQSKQEKLSHWTGRFYRLPDNSLVRDRMNGLSTYSDFSSDNGATWQLSESSNGTTATFTSRTSGYGLAFKAMGMTSSTFSLSKTIDGGKTWVPIGKTFDSDGMGTPMQLVVLANNQPLVFNGAQLMSTPDEGATWRVEWPLAPSSASVPVR